MDEVIEIVSDPGDRMPEVNEFAGSEEPDPTDRLARIIESVLFAASTPTSLRRLGDVLGGPTTKDIQAALARLRTEYAPGQRGIQLHEVAGGYQFRTARENAEWVRAVFREKPARLGRAALETLAVVAYKQPVTRAEIEAIRGVDVDGVLSTLMSRRLIKIAGRKEAVGRPLLYTTTPEFLETFGLKDLNELPSLKELGPAPDGDEETTTEASEPIDSGTATAAPLDTPTAESADESAAEQHAPGDRTAESTVDLSTAGAAAENPEPSGDRVAAQSRGADRGGARAGERDGGDAAGEQGESANRSDHD